MKRRELLQLSALTAASVVFPAAARGQDLEGEYPEERLVNAFFVETLIKSKRTIRGHCVFFQ